jgi:hypothetical protein
LADAGQPAAGQPADAGRDPAPAVQVPGSRSADSIADLVLRGAPRLGGVRLVTIDGPSGSGKSTLARRVRDAVAARGRAVALVPTDHWATFADPFGWWPQLESQLLEPLASGHPARYVACDWDTGVPVFDRPITIPVPDVLVLEGVSSSRRAVSERTTVGIWIYRSDPASRLERVLRRDGFQIRDAMLAWQQAEEEWFARDDPRSRATIVLGD